MGAVTHGTAWVEPGRRGLGQQERTDRLGVAGYRAGLSDDTRLRSCFKTLQGRLAAWGAEFKALHVYRYTHADRYDCRHSQDLCGIDGGN